MEEKRLNKQKTVDAIIHFFSFFFSSASLPPPYQIWGLFVCLFYTFL